MSLKDKPVRPGAYIVEYPVIESEVEEPTSPQRKDRSNKEGEHQHKERKEHKEHKEHKKAAYKLSSLNAQLVAHGYTKRSLRLDALSDSDQAQVAAVISDLLSASSSKVSALEDANAKIKTLHYEQDRLLKQMDKHDREMGRLESEVQAARNLTDHAERRQQEEEVKVKVLREDVARGRKALDNMKIAATQEAKRAQMKLDKVLAQLARQVPAVPPTFELLNPVPPGHISPVAAGPSPLFEASLSDLSALRQSLQEEIEAFRHVAVSTANALREALAAGTGEDPPRRLVADEFYALHPTSRHVRQMASWTAHPVIADTRLKALVADVRAALTAGVSPIMRDGLGATEEAEMAEELKRMERAREREFADLQDKVKDLEVELGIAAAKNEEANKVVEQMAKLSVQGGVPSTTDFADSRLRDELVRQKRLLDAERESLRDHTMRMTEERMALDADRAAFVANKEAAIAAAVEAAKAEAEAAARALAQAPPSPAAAPIQPHSPPRKPRHHPVSPSPLSPHKRSPAHVALRRKAPRTPLSRLVLERAVLERDNKRKGGLRASARGSAESASSSGSSGSGSGVLGESARDNLAASKGKSRESDLAAARKPEAKPEPPRKSSLFAPTSASAARAKSEKTLSSSRPAVGPAAPKARAWR